MAQLSLALTLPELFSDSSFFVSDCNRVAYDTVLNQKNWLGHAIYLQGEKSAGKTHLVHIWAEKFSADIFLANLANPAAGTKNLVLEDIEQLTDERTLLHLFNSCKENGFLLLMTSALMSNNLPFTLPDLTSRLRACQVVSIEPPDDDLIAQVMRKQFSDKQLLVDDEVINYLTMRTERSLANVKNIVEQLDKNSLEEGRKITVPFIKRILGF